MSRGERLSTPAPAAAQRVVCWALFVLRRVFNVSPTASACFSLSTVTNAARWSVGTRRWAPSALMTAARDLWTDPWSPVGLVLQRGETLLESASERELQEWVLARDELLVQAPVMATSPSTHMEVCDAPLGEQHGERAVIRPPGTPPCVWEPVESAVVRPSTPPFVGVPVESAVIRPPTPLWGQEPGTPPCVWEVEESRSADASEASTSRTPSVAGEEDWMDWLASSP